MPSLRKMFFCLFFVPCSFILPVVQQVFANVLSQTAVQNIEILKQTNGCPKCDLSGTDLTRMVLAGANLEGADLSRAKMALCDLSGANLRNADLRETSFGGADLADADLRGADLRGTSFAGAYIKGTLFEGEMVVTKPYLEENIDEVEETVYVEDTVVAKPAPEAEAVNISSPRVFEETPPVLPSVASSTVSQESQSSISVAPAAMESRPAPDVKKAPSISRVKMSAVQEKEKTSEQKSVSSTKEPEVKRIAVSKSKDLRTHETQSTVHEDPQTTVETEINEEHTTPVPQITGLSHRKAKAAPVETHGDRAEPPVEPATKASQPEEEQEKSKSVEDGLAEVVAVTESVMSEDTDPSVPQQSDEAIRILQNRDLLLERNHCYSCDLKGVALEGEDLEDADLESADLSHAKLRGADLEGANLKGVTFLGADLRDVNLENADLYKADLTGADLTGANLEGTLFDDCVMVGVKGYQQKTLLMME